MQIAHLNSEVVFIQNKHKLCFFPRYVKSHRYLKLCSLIHIWLCINIYIHISYIHTLYVYLPLILVHITISLCQVSKIVDKTNFWKWNNSYFDEYIYVNLYIYIILDLTLFTRVAFWFKGINVRILYFFILHLKVIHTIFSI